MKDPVRRDIFEAQQAGRTIRLEHFSHIHHVIFVDDEPDVLASFLRDLEPWLTARGLTADGVASADEALALLDERYPDTGLVVSDLRMPGTSGDELFARIHAAYPDVGGVLVTAYSDMQRITRAVAAHILGLIQKPWDIAHLTAELERAAGEVDAKRATAAQNRQLTEQFEMAAQFQQGIMGVREEEDPRIRVEAYSRPAPGLYLSGDFYDLRRLSGDRYRLVIGDAVGTGIRPALVGAMAKISTRLTDASPAIFLETLNRHLSTMLPTAPGILVTCLAIDIDLGAGRLTASNAGHFPPILLSPQPRRPYIPREPALGFDPDQPYRDSEIPLSGEERLVVYTDGLVAESPRHAGPEADPALSIEHLLAHAHRSDTFLDEIFRLRTAERLMAQRPVVPLFGDDVTIVSVAFPKEH